MEPEQTKSTNPIDATQLPSTACCGRHSRQWIIAGIIFVVTGLLVGGGVYAVMGKRLVVERATLARQIADLQNQIMQLKTNTVAQSDIDTSNWSTYRNEMYGYSISYPGAFTIYKETNQKTQTIIPPSKDEAQVFITDKKENLFCCEVVKSAVKVVKGSIDTKNWKQYANIPDYRVKEQKAIMFQGRPAYEVLASSGIDSEGALVILIPSNTYSLIIIQGDDSLTWQKITESFKFTD